MSDIERIQDRIAKIRAEIASDPSLARDIEQRSAATHDAVHRAEEAMRSAKVIPITKGRRKSAGEVEL